MSTTLTAAPGKLTTAALANAQQAHAYFAYEGDYQAQQLERLRRIYAGKRQEYNNFMDLVESTQPDVVLRTADGQQLVLRLESGKFGEVYAALRDALSESLREFEAQIVRHVETMEDDAALTANREETEHARITAGILALCAPSDPTLAAPALSAGNIWAQRTDAAEAREEALQQQYSNQHAYGREIMWHPSFPAEYVASMGGLPLVEVAEVHEQLARTYNQDRALDSHDYRYLADCLREALAGRTTNVKTLRLRRALELVEQALVDAPALRVEAQALPAERVVEEKPLMQVAA